MLKRASRDAPASRKREGHHRADLDDLRPPLEIAFHGQHAEAPHPGQHRRRNAKGDHIGQRIELTAEVAGRIRQPRDAAVEEVENDGDTDGLRRLIEVPGIAAVPWMACAIA